MANGGALKADNDEVWNRLIALAGGRGARFVVFGTAAEDPEASAKQVVEQLQRRGAIAEALPVAPKFSWVDLNKVVRDAALIAKVRNAKGIFFTGGSQERIVDVLFPGGHSTPMLDAIWDVYRKGGVVAGTSAGAAVMSTVMFRDAPSVISILKGQWEEGKQIDRGLGFVGPARSARGAGCALHQQVIGGRYGPLPPAMQQPKSRWMPGALGRTAEALRTTTCSRPGSSAQRRHQQLLGCCMAGGKETVSSTTAAVQQASASSGRPGGSVSQPLYWMTLGASCRWHRRRRPRAGGGRVPEMASVSASASLTWPR